MSILNSINSIFRMYFPYKKGTILIQNRPSELEYWDEFNPVIVYIVLVGKKRYKVLEYNKVQNRKGMYRLRGYALNEKTDGDYITYDIGFKPAAELLRKLDKNDLEDPNIVEIVSKLQNKFEVSEFINK